MQFNPIEGLERRSSSRAELSCVFTSGPSCFYIQYKTYLFYSNRRSWSYVQPVDHFPKTPPDLVISWCDSVKLFFTVPCRILYLTSQNWVILFCRGFLQFYFFLILNLCTDLRATSPSFTSLANVPSFLFPGCYWKCGVPSDVGQSTQPECPFSLTVRWDYGTENHSPAMIFQPLLQPPQII